MIENRKIRILILSVAMMLILFLSECSPTKRFVGRKVSYWDPFFCTFYNLPKSCTTVTKNFEFDFKISEGDISGEYVIKGGATYRGAPWRLVRRESRFFLLLARQGVITDKISLFVKGSDLSRRLPFKKTFKSQPFDAVGIGYQITMVD